VSYDVYLLPREAAGDDPGAAYLALEESETERPSAELEPRLRAVADELCALSPGLERSESQQPFWSIQLLDAEAESSAMVELYADHGVVMFSYGAADFAAAIEETGRYVEVFERHGFVAYDPQTEKLFDAEADGEQIAKTAQWVFDQTVAKHSAPRPWWKRLLG
jgi:hypothetical protein